MVLHLAVCLASPVGALTLFLAIWWQRQCLYWGSHIDAIGSHICWCLDLRGGSWCHHVQRHWMPCSHSCRWCEASRSGLWSEPWLKIESLRQCCMVCPWWNQTGLHFAMTCFQCLEIRYSMFPKLDTACFQMYPSTACSFPSLWIQEQAVTFQTVSSGGCLFQYDCKP